MSVHYKRLPGTESRILRHCPSFITVEKYSGRSSKHVDCMSILSCYVFVRLDKICSATHKMRAIKKALSSAGESHVRNVEVVGSNPQTVQYEGLPSLTKRLSFYNNAQMPFQPV